MALIPIFETLNILSYKSTDKKKINIIIVCAGTDVNKKQPKYILIAFNQIF